MSAIPRAFTLLDFAQLMAVVLIWGATNICSKIIVDAFPPMMAAALRFGIALSVLAFFIRKPPPGQWRNFLLVLFVMGPLHFGVQYVGLRMAEDAAPMVVAMQIWAPASVICAAVLLKERVSPLRWAGVVLAFVGVAWMNFDPAILAQIGALSLVAAAAIAYGLGAVLVRRFAGSVGPWPMLGWVSLVTAVTMTFGTVTFEQGHVEAAREASWLAWACVGFAGLFSSIVASALVFRLVQRYEVSRTTPYLLLAPVISFAIAYWLLGETITLQLIAGAALTMAGVALVAIAESRVRAIA